MTTKTIEELRDHEELSSLGSRLAGNGAAMGAFLGDLAEALGHTDTDGAGLYMETSDVIAAILELRAALADMRIRRDASREEADNIGANRDEWKAIAATCIDAERDACARACEANANRFKVDGMDADLHHAHMADARDIRAR